MPKQKRPWVNAERSPITGDLAVGIAQGKKDEQLGPHQDPYSQRLIEFNNLITIRMIVREFLIEQFDHSLIEAQQAEQLREEAEEARRASTNSEEERRALQAAADAEREAEQRLLALIREAEAQAELDTLHMLEMLKQILSEIDAKLYQLSHEIHVAATEYYSLLEEHIDFHHTTIIDLNDYDAELKPGISRNVPIKLEYGGDNIVRLMKPELIEKMRAPGFRYDQLSHEESKMVDKVFDQLQKDFYAETFVHPESVVTPAKVKKDHQEAKHKFLQALHQVKKVEVVKRAENVVQMLGNKKQVLEGEKKVCEVSIKAFEEKNRIVANKDQIASGQINKKNIGTSKMGLYGKGRNSPDATQKQRKTNITPQNKT